MLPALILVSLLLFSLVEVGNGEVGAAMLPILILIAAFIFSPSRVGALLGRAFHPLARGFRSGLEGEEASTREDNSEKKILQIPFVLSKKQLQAAGAAALLGALILYGMGRMSQPALPNDISDRRIESLNKQCHAGENRLMGFVGGPESQIACNVLSDVLKRRACADGASILCHWGEDPEADRRYMAEHEAPKHSMEKLVSPTPTASDDPVGAVMGPGYSPDPSQIAGGNPQFRDTPEAKGLRDQAINEMKQSLDRARH